MLHKKIVSLSLLALLMIGMLSSCGLFKKGRCDRCPEFTLEEQRMELENDCEVVEHEAQEVLGAE